MPYRRFALRLALAILLGLVAWAALLGGALGDGETTPHELVAIVALAAQAFAWPWPREIPGGPS